MVDDQRTHSEGIPEGIADFFYDLPAALKAATGTSGTQDGDGFTNHDGVLKSKAGNINASANTALQQSPMRDGDVAPVAGENSLSVDTRPTSQNTNPDAGMAAFQALNQDNVAVVDGGSLQHQVQHTKPESTFGTELHVAARYGLDATLPLSSQTAAAVDAALAPKSAEPEAAPQKVEVEDVASFDAASLARRAREIKNSGWQSVIPGKPFSDA